MAQCFERRVRRRIAAVVGIWKNRRRTEYVAMRIASAGRQNIDGSAGIGIGRQARFHRVVALMAKMIGARLSSGRSATTIDILLYLLCEFGITDGNQPACR